LSLAEAITIALDENRSLAVARQDLASSQAGLGRAHAPDLPSLTANTSVANGARNTTPGPATSLTPSLSLAYDFGTDGSKGGNLAVAELQAKISELEVSRLVDQTRLDVTNAYYDAQQAEEQMRIAQSALSHAEEGMRAAQALRRGGLGTLFDTQRAETQLANARQELVSARGSLRTARRALVRLLGVKDGPKLVPADPVEQLPGWSQTLDRTIEVALAKRPDLAQQRLRTEVADRQVALARAGGALRTTLSADTDLSTMLQTSDGSPTIFQQAYSYGYRIVGTLQYPLFNNGAVDNAVRQAEANRQSAELRLADAIADVRLRVERAYFLFESSRQNVETSALELESAKIGMRSARDRFNAGVGTQTEVIDAENDLKRAEGNRVRALLDHNRSVATLRSLTLE
jgi:outer membrane protein TolC